MPRQTKKSRPRSSARHDVGLRASAVEKGSRSVLIAAVVLSLTVLIVYGRAIDAPFIFDDSNSVETNETVISLWPLVGDAAEPGPLRTPEHGPTAGRPLVNFSFAANYWLGDLNPAGYRLVNIGLHVLSALLLWAIVHRTLRLPLFQGRFDAASKWLALTVALLWAVHPLQTESVVYITQRTELMMGVFYLATLYCSLRYLTAVPITPGSGGSEAAPQGNIASRRLSKQRSLWLVLAVLACLAGMASKEVMASAPLIVLLFDRTFVAGSLRRALRQSWPLYLGLAGTWALRFWLSYHSPHNDSIGFHLGVPAYAWWFTQAKVLLMYFKLVAWPWPLMIHYELPYLDSFSSAWMYVLPVAVLGIAILVLLWRNRPVGFLGTCVFAILLPTLVIPIVTEVAAERRMYLPLAAITTFVVIGAYCLAQSMRRGVSAPTAGPRFAAPLARVVVPALVVAIVFSAVSVHRLGAYQDEMTLWQEVLLRQPHNHLAHEAVGNLHFRENRLREAIAHLREAIRLKPDLSSAHYSLGEVMLATNEYDKAAAHFRDAVRYHTGSPELFNNLGVALYVAEQNDEAMAALREAIKLQPNMWRAHENLGTALVKAGRLQEAIAEFERAIEINPNASGVYSRLAYAEATIGQTSKAIATAEQGLELARLHADHDAASKIDAQIKSYRARLANADISSANAAAPGPSPN